VPLRDLATGKPVKLVYSREQVMLSTRAAHVCGRREVQVHADGLLQSLDLDVTWMRALI